MKTPGTFNFRSIAGKIMMGLVLAAMFGSVGVATVSARDGDWRGEDRDDRRFEHRGHDRHDRGRYYRGRRVYRPYGYVEPVYVEPVYVAPPVYYAPPPAPGISIFLPT